MNPQAPKLSTQILEEASDWFVDFSEGTVDAAAREQFDAWLRRSPEHVQAYLKITALWEEAPMLDSGRTLASNELVGRALAETNVVSLSHHGQFFAQSASRGQTGPDELRGQQESAPPGSRASTHGDSSHASPLGGEQQRSTGKGRAKLFAVAASLVGVVAVASTWFYVQRDTYSTVIGEQRSIRLNDGSTVDLNSQSKIRVRFTEHRRNVVLLEGQALFRVAKDVSRPFVVATTDTHVRAVGTQFDVYRKDSGTIVTVVEGRVAVLSGLRSFPLSNPRASSADSQSDDSSRQAASDIALLQMIGKRSAVQSVKDVAHSRSSEDLESENAPAIAPSTLAADTAAVSEPLPAALAPHEGEILLSAGEQVTVSPEVMSQPQRADVAAATAWTQHRIVFHGSPLKDVVREFNRYNERQIVVTDADILSTKISGVFSSTDADSLLKFLRALPNVSVDESGRDIRISRK